MRRLLFALGAILTIFGSCQKNESVHVKTGHAFYAAIEETPSTKTVMDDDNNVLWADNDQIIVFMKTSLGLKYQVAPEYVGMTSAKFTKVTAGGSDDLYAGSELPHNIAYYPYSSSINCRKSGEHYELSVSLPSEQTYVESSFGNGSLPMAAISEDNNITFKNVCGGIKLLLKGTCKVSSITIEGKNNEKLSGKANVTVYTDESKPSIAMNDNASATATLNCGEGVQLNETDATEFIISLPPTEFTKGLTITMTDSNGATHIIETSKSNSVLRSSLLTMPPVEFNAASDGITNLSAAGTSNCYIVSKPGTYTFTPAKGNSGELVGAITSAATLWESFGTEETPSEGDLIKNVVYDNGVIRFETHSTFNEGNAVIAAKDGNGEILWSWHIWLTDEPQKQVYYNNAGVMMDRNLGATSATAGDIEALGLLYQWGRKDPFLGASSIKMTENDTTEIQIRARSTIVWPEQVESSEHTGTIEYSIQNPTTFIYWNLLDRDWLYSGSGAKNMSRWQSQKTIYDPCPAGWRVPDGIVSGIWATASGISDGLHSPEISYNTENVGADFAGILGDDPSIWYPAAGRISPSGSIEFPYSGHYWSVTPYMLGAGIFEFTESYQYPGHSFIGTKVYAYCASADSVRCVQE